MRRRWFVPPHRFLAVAPVLVGCATTASTPSAQYGGLRDPFPAAPASEPPKASAQPTEPATAPSLPASSAVPASAPSAGKTCGPACALCSRAAETCDEEIRGTGKWDGVQCRRKEQICAPLTALQNATGCTCD